MQRKVLFTIVTIFLTLVFTACGAPAAPQAAEADTAAEAEATEAPAEEEAEAEPTEAPAEEEAENGAEEGEDAEADSDEDATMEEMAYTVDTEASSVVWVGSKPLQYSHTGTIDIAEGQLTLGGEQVVSGSFVMDMTSIENADLSGDKKADLEGHLRSDDFFGVDTYPTASLTIKSAELTGENEYTVVADLTIKDITNEISFVATVEMGDGTLTATSDFVFNRADFDVRYDSGSFFDNLGDKLISDDV